MDTMVTRLDPRLKKIGFTPLIDPAKGQERDFFTGEDVHGEYLACRLNNMPRTALYGHYVFVLPERKHLMENHSWCGNIAFRKSNFIEVRRREVIDGKQHSISLGREIWEDSHKHLPDGAYVFSLNHQLDFRLNQLCITSRGTNRGVAWHEKGKTWQVQVMLRSKNTYVGCTKGKNEGYRMYNRYLRKLRAEQPNDGYIQAMPYNKV